MFMKNLTTRVPNYKHIYFSYSTVTSACQGSGLACTRTVSIFRKLRYMQTHFRHENKPFCIVIGMKSIATKLFYQHTPIDTAIYEKFMCYNHTTLYTAGWFLTHYVIFIRQLYTLLGGF